MDYLKIVLRSDLCAGNGESVGNAVDTDVCMDQAGLPYIPSRRLKGCLRQAALDLKRMGYPDAEEQTRKLFGDPFGKEGCLHLQDAVIKGAASIRKLLLENIEADQRGLEGFSGKIPEAVKRMAHPANIQKMFSGVRGQTRLENGVKVENTLRFTRVIGQYHPLAEKEDSNLEFYAPVYLETEEPALKEFLRDCCRAMRHMGLSRNRGLGNVTVSLQEKEAEAGCKRDVKQAEKDRKQAEKNRELQKSLAPQAKVRLSFFVTLDAPVTLPGCDELNTSIPARSVIGCMAANYLRNGSPGDEAFASLFLNGDVCWSSLTPVINGTISAPAPMMLVKLKNEKGRMINHLAQEDFAWKGKKPKTLDSSFAALCGNTYYVAEPEVHSVYHHSVHRTVQDPLLLAEGETAGAGQELAASEENGDRLLYMQDCIEAGLIYGGTVLCPAAMADTVLACIKEARLRFGRSRNAQYAACSLKEEPVLERYEETQRYVPGGERIYVILKSDLALQKDARYVTEAEEVRKILAEKLSVAATLPQGERDFCRYHTVGGFQNVWQLQKPQVPVVRAGSVYCFESDGQMFPSQIQAGEFLQEGFGICEIVTKGQMKEAALVSEGRIDRAGPEQEEKLWNVYSRLLAEAGVEAMRRYALDYRPKQERLPLGRLRLMLSQAADLADLLRMIGTMKESDISSENEIGRKRLSEELIRDLYTETGMASVSLKKLLRQEDGLWEEIENSPQAQALLLKKWKLPLEIVLHKLHYQKER